tara:strand:- start:3 stop:1043 length:1041 start_codon:yes stop_codon:yes gene_type:complete
MAIEDEIVNISDLDVGSEILKTDKLIVETNNGTKLLDFKDFVIGLDNISFYHLISGRGDNVGNKEFITVGGFKVLKSNTDLDHKPTYEDLKGGIELSKRNYQAYTTLQDISAIPGQNQGDIQNILARLGQITALLETPQEVALKAGAKIRLNKVKSWTTANNSAPKKDKEWYDGRPADLEIMADGTDTDIVTLPARLLSTTSSTVDSVNFKVSVTGNDISLPSSGNLSFNRTAIDPAAGTLVRDPFKMTYPAAGSFSTSTISFDAYIEILYGSGELVPIEVYVSGNLARKRYPQKIGTDRYVYDFGFVDEIKNNDIILIKYGASGRSGYNAPKIGAGSSFSGVRMF